MRDQNSLWCRCVELYASSDLTCLCLCCCSPAGVRPDPGDCGGDDGDGGRHHLPAEPLPPVSTLPPLQTRLHAQETPAVGQRESNATFSWRRSLRTVFFKSKHVKPEGERVVVGLLTPRQFKRSCTAAAFVSLDVAMTSVMTKDQARCDPWLNEAAG